MQSVNLLLSITARFSLQRTRSVTSQVKFVLNSFLFYQQTEKDHLLKEMSWFTCSNTKCAQS